MAFARTSVAFAAFLLVPQASAQPEILTTSTLSDVRRLTLAAEGASAADFLPGGNDVLIRRSMIDGAASLVVLSLEDGRTRPIPTDGNVLGAGSPHPVDARTLVVLAGEGSETAGVLYEVDAGGARRLAEGLEGAYSPTGRHIVFSGHNCGDLDKEATVQANLRLCLMDLSTGDVRTLSAPGTGQDDRDPAWSPDGATIVFSRMSVEQSELYRLSLAEAAMPEAAALTALGAQAKEPTFHPSGDYVIFTTTSLDDEDADLFLIDPAGGYEPVRVLASPGPQSQPTFAPTGDKVAWTGAIMMQANDDEEAIDTGRREVFLAGWEHEGALALLRAAPPLSAVVQADLDGTDNDISEDDLRRHVGVLTSEAMAGRMTGSPGEQAATAYVAAAFNALGLEPAGDDGYFQSFSFRYAGRPLPESTLIFEREGNEPLSMTLSEDWVPLAFSATTETASTPLVFGGFGFDAPEWEGHPPVDSYGDLDVAGKWVLLWRGNPPGVEASDRPDLTRLSSLVNKSRLAAEKGAAGVILMRAPSVSTSGANLPGPTVAADEGTYPIPVVVVGSAHNETLLAGQDREQLLAMAGAGKLIARSLPGVSVRTSIGLDVEMRSGRNVLGRLDLDGATNNPPVILGGHIDHLGRGLHSMSANEPIGEALVDRRRRLYVGADDNASGIAALIEIAQSLVKNQPAGAVRDVIFAAWSGEELGLLGSSHYVATLGEVKNDVGEKVVVADEVAAYLNLDMIGRLRETLQVRGVGTSSVWPSGIERANAAIGLRLAPRREASSRMDTAPFERSGVPVLAFYTGWHEQYHQPSDRVELLNFDGLARISRLVERVLLDLARSHIAPDFTEAKEQSQ
ncbi:MAG: M28 family peptidase [Pseudomonadota bacterium]